MYMFKLSLNKLTVINEGLVCFNKAEVKPIRAKHRSYIFYDEKGMRR